MDGSQFDWLTKRLSSRRTAIGGLLAGLILPLDVAARKKGKDKQRRQRGKDKQRTKTQAEPCWRAGACIPKKGANVSRCDLSGYTTFPTQDCTGCNLSGGNLSGVTARNVNFTKANLSGACLVNADFTGATFAKSTNLANAVFCNTTMPDGTPNNDGCNAGTACCSTCIPETCGHGRICADGGCSCPPETPPNECRQQCRFGNTMTTTEGCTMCTADVPSCGQPDRYPPCSSSAECNADAACIRGPVGCGAPGVIGVCVRLCSTA